MAGFMCSEGEKKHVVYDEHIESDVTVCRECYQNLPLYKKKKQETNGTCLCLKTDNSKNYAVNSFFL